MEGGSEGVRERGREGVRSGRKGATICHRESTRGREDSVLIWFLRRGGEDDDSVN